MNLNKHSDLEGRHAFLSPSKGHWLDYDEDKLSRVYHTAVAAKRGTDLHDLAFNLIRLNVRLPESPTTLNMYVNDAIGYRMTPEQSLFYSKHCFGTADTLGFRNNTLRVHDLKTGVNETSMRQLEIYAAIFCHEYRFHPFEIKMELRIYQNDKIVEHEPSPDKIMHIIDTMQTHSKFLDYLSEEVPL